MFMAILTLAQILDWFIGWKMKIACHRTEDRNEIDNHAENGDNNSSQRMARRIYTLSSE